VSVDSTGKMGAMTSTRAGRFAPSPTGDLHLGNLRTALLAYLFARTSGLDFLLRVEDLDRVRAGSADRQVADLRALGLDWDGPITYQSERYDRYGRALARLAAAGLTYECFCTRREIADASSAPQLGAERPPASPSRRTDRAAGSGTRMPDRSDRIPDPSGRRVPPGAYPGTCRHLTETERNRRRAAGRPPAIRLRTRTDRWTIHDDLCGETTADVDDFVLQRNDGVVAYNLAVVVDDAAQHIDQVVRADDLLTSAPRQAYLAHLLGHRQPRYAHVPLAVNMAGLRLAKRDGAVTLADLANHGVTPPLIRSVIAESLGLAEPGEPVTVQRLTTRFDPEHLPLRPWVVDPETVTGLVG
jgi:glutamyl-tRNA synthetase